jgi:hypothetical protein
VKSKFPNVSCETEDLLKNKVQYDILYVDYTMKVNNIRMQVMEFKPLDGI